MGQLNLRGMDDELIRQIKATAASEGQTIPAFVAEVLERDRRRGGWSSGDSVREEASSGLVEGARGKRARASEVEKTPAASGSSAACPECGSLSGHQRWCKRK